MAGVGASEESGNHSDDDNSVDAVVKSDDVALLLILVSIDIVINSCDPLGATGLM